MGDTSNNKDVIIRFENFLSGNNISRIDKLEQLCESFDLSFIIGKIVSSMTDEQFKEINEHFENMKLHIDIEKINEEKGRLKRLVGKAPDAYLTSGDTLKLGRIIAGMSGTPRRDHVGIINFLGASCRIHHEIKNSYMNQLRSKMTGAHSTKAKNTSSEE